MQRLRDKVSDKSKDVRNTIKKVIRLIPSSYDKETRDLHVARARSYTLTKLPEIHKIRTATRLLQHRLRAVRNKQHNRLFLKFHYSRYADDFIIVGNFGVRIAKQIKEDLKNWLSLRRKATLSDPKTIITDLRKAPCWVPQASPLLRL